jgi:hypothetical protein
MPTPHASLSTIGLAKFGFKSCVHFTSCRYSHVEKSVFLLEPNEKTWGVPDADKVPLPGGQTYLALLTQRPSDYLMYRAMNPIDSTVSESVLLPASK